MYCRYCGQSIADDSDFCTYCGKSLVDTLDKTCKEQKSTGNPFTQHAAIFVKTLCFIALGVFLFFNMKMAPFYGGWKFLAYIVEGVIAISLSVVTIRKIADCSSMVLKVLSMFFSLLIILSSIGLRILYDNKVDIALKDIPSSGSILVDIDCKTEYYSYLGGVIYDPYTSVELNGANDIAEITLGKPIRLEIECEGNNIKGSINDTITLYASDFKNCEYTTSKSIDKGASPGLRATIEITLKRVCTFWEVIFY